MGNIRKNEKFGMVITKQGEMHDKCGSVEYLIPSKLANALISQEKKKHKGKLANPQQFLINYVNDNCGLMRTCTKVTLV